MAHKAIGADRLPNVEEGLAKRSRERTSAMALGAVIHAAILVSLALSSCGGELELVCAVDGERICECAESRSQLSPEAEPVSDCNVPNMCKYRDPDHANCFAMPVAVATDPNATPDSICASARFHVSVITQIRDLVVVDHCP